MTDSRDDPVAPAPRPIVGTYPFRPRQLGVLVAKFEHVPLDFVAQKLTATHSLDSDLVVEVHPDLDAPAVSRYSVLVWTTLRAERPE